MNNVKIKNMKNGFEVGAVYVCTKSWPYTTSFYTLDGEILHSIKEHDVFTVLSVLERKENELRRGVEMISYKILFGDNIVKIFNSEMNIKSFVSAGVFKKIC